VYVFDPDFLDRHELAVARYAAAHPQEFLLPGRAEPGSDEARAAAESLVRDILEALCHRDGLSLESAAAPGEPARNYELADRLGIGRVFGLRELP
jgi:hypothetical protein